MTHRTRASLAAVTAAAFLSVAGCGQGGAESGAPALPTSDPTAKVDIGFWGWAPGYKEAVALWNSTHPATKVTFEETPSTQKIYPKMFTAVKAGNAPCLGQVGYESIPNFIVQDGVADIASLATRYESEFTPGGWKSVQVGKGVYGIPVDTAPMAMIYRKDLFQKYGITVPTTWEEYREAAVKVKKADPSVSLGYVSNDPNYVAGLSRQAGARWFTLGADSWKVTIDDAPTKKVAQFWQGMLDDKLMTAQESFSPALYKQMTDGKILSEVFGLWNTAVISQNAASTSGKWAVAPMPTWKDRPGVHSEMGGSATVVLKGCAHPDRAVEFAHWMSTDPQAVSILIEKGGLWPAAASGLTNPALDRPLPFYGGAAIYGPFKEISRSMNVDWTWGPLQNEVNNDLLNEVPKASAANPLPAIIGRIQQQAVKDITDKGLKVG